MATAQAPRVSSLASLWESSPSLPLHSFLSCCSGGGVSAVPLKPLTNMLLACSQDQR